MGAWKQPEPFLYFPELGKKATSGLETAEAFLHVSLPFTQGLCENWAGAMQKQSPVKQVHNTPHILFVLKEIGFFFKKKREDSASIGMFLLCVFNMTILYGFTPRIGENLL